MVENTRRVDDKGFMKYWPLIVTITLGIMFYATTTLKLSSADDLHKSHTEKLDDHTKRIASLERAVMDLAAMRDDIRDIRNHLMKIP